MKKGLKMKKYLIYAVVIGIIGFGFYKKVYVPKNTFKTLSATIGNAVLKVNGVGNIGSKEIYKIGSIYGGKVSSFNVNEGDFIKKGTLIAVIDSIDLSDKISEQTESIKKFKNDIKGLGIDKQSATTSYNYQNEIFKRNQRLFKKGAISELDFKRFRTNKDVAKLQINSISSKINSLYAQISQINANTNGLKEKLSRYTIYSPVDGYITKKLISNFAIINPNQTLIEIINPKDVWIETHIDTRISGDVKIGDIAIIKLRSSDINYKGKVTNIKPVNNSVTNEREVDISFDNLPIPFYLEEQAIIDIKIKQLENVVKVPSSALSIYEEKEGVWIVENGVVKFKTLKILVYTEEGAVTKGITIKDKLVIPDPGKKTLSNGMKIYND